jgi:hypothetical protein
MVKVLSVLVLGVSIIQVLNYMFMKYGATENVLMNNFKLIIMTLPLQILASMAFAYFYSHGAKSDFPYAYLSIIAFAASLIASFLVSILILNMRAPTAIGLFALFFTLTGIGLFLYAKMK